MQLRSDDVTWQELDGEIVALDLRTSRYLTVNGTGTVLWGMLNRPCSRDDLAAALVDRFGIATETARADVDAFVDDLDERGLLER